MPLEVKLGVVHEAVPGAPFQVGQRVRVVCMADDDSLDERFVGQLGVVAGLVYDDVAQYPNDPMVLLDGGQLGTDVFFPEELRAEAELDPERPRHRPYRQSVLSRGP